MPARTAAPQTASSRERWIFDRAKNVQQRPLDLRLDFGWTFDATIGGVFDISSSGMDIQEGDDDDRRTGGT